MEAFPWTSRGRSALVLPCATVLAILCSSLHAVRGSGELVVSEEAASVKSVDGIFALSGKNSHVIPASELPAGLSSAGDASEVAAQAVNGTVMFSLYLTSHSTEGVRSILCKGSGPAQRTPCLLLMPGSNRISYRVTSQSNVETWGTSKGEVAAERWCHVAMVFGTSRDAPAAGFVSLFLDGRYDSGIQMGTPPSANENALILGHAPGAGGAGVKGYVAHLTLASGAASSWTVQSHAEWARGGSKVYHFISDRSEQNWDRQGDKCPELSLAEVLNQSLDSCVHCSPAFMPSTVMEPPRTEAPSWTKPPPFDVNKLLHNATEGNVESLLTLAWASHLGVDLPRCDEAALFYMHEAARRAFDRYQQVGKQYSAEQIALTPRTQIQRQDHKGVNSEESDALAAMSQSGDSRADIELGSRFFWGHRGFPKNHTLAIGHYEQAHLKGNVHGTLALAKMLIKGEGRQDVGRGMTLMAGIAEMKPDEVGSAVVAEAHNAMGHVHFNGKVVGRNATAALLYFERAAATGSRDGAYNAGVLMLLEEEGRHADAHRAYMYFKAAARGGSKLATYRAGLQEARGLGVRRNATLGFQSFWQMAQNGPWSEHLQIGLTSYLEGRYEDALWHYQKASNLGYPIAGYNYAFIVNKMRVLSRSGGALIRLLGGFRSLFPSWSHPPSSPPMPLRMPRLAERQLLSEAVGWDLRAWAHNEMGRCAQFGPPFGCEQDLGKAISHYEQAAALQSVEAHVNLAELHFWGAGDLSGGAARAWELLDAAKSLAGERDKTLDFAVNAFRAMDVARKAACSTARLASAVEGTLLGFTGLEASGLRSWLIRTCHEE